MQNKTRRLWGQEINVVKGGLAEEQVISFVAELLGKYRDLATRQEHFLSLGALSERAAGEADKLAESARARAREEAAAETTNTVVQARQRAEEMVATAKKTAQEVTRTEADSLLQAARRKAAIIETEAKQRSQLYLIKAGEAIEDELKRERNEGYEQLLSALRNVLSEEHDIEARWKGKFVDMWRQGPELGEYEAVPLVLAAEITKASSRDGGENKAKIAVSEAELMAKEEEVFFEATATEDTTPQGPTGEDVVPRVTTAEQADQWMKTLTTEKLEPVAGESPEEEAVKPIVGSAQPGGESPTIQEHSVDLHLTAPVELSVASRIYAVLHATPEIEVLRTVGSYDKGTTITLLLKKPLPLLVDMLTAIPGVEVAPETPGRQRFVSRATGGQGNGGAERLTIRVRTTTLVG